MAEIWQTMYADTIFLPCQKYNNTLEKDEISELTSEFILTKLRVVYKRQ